MNKDEFTEDEFTKDGYSKDFKFFLEHQISIVESRGYSQYNSRIESRNFLTDVSDKSDEAKIDECRKIHSELINNK